MVKFYLIRHIWWLKPYALLFFFQKKFVLPVHYSCSPNVNITERPVSKPVSKTISTFRQTATHEPQTAATGWEEQISQQSVKTAIYLD